MMNSQVQLTLVPARKLKSECRVLLDKTKALFLSATLYPLNKYTSYTAYSLLTQWPRFCVVFTNDSCTIA